LADLPDIEGGYVSVLGDAVGYVHALVQLSLPAASPGSGANLSPAAASASAKAFSRIAATREAVGAIMTSSDAISGPSKSPCARPHKATRVASSRLTLEQVGRWISMAAGAEQEGIHGDGEVGQHFEKSRELEAAMQDRAFARQGAILLPLAERPQHEALANRQVTGATQAPTSRLGVELERAKSLFWRTFHGLTGG
jgi:hypothetical protein